MGWETRRGRRYYYQARKAGGRVIKEYVGSGHLAEAVAVLNASIRAERFALAQERRAERERAAAVDTTVNAAHGDIEILLQANLVLSGYHRHHRGEWRRRRDG
jgi:hypothetical protein